MLDRLTSRAVIALMYEAIDAVTLPSWVTGTSFFAQSDQPSEEYAWLGQTPQMREWIGPRLVKALREQGLTIRNKKFEASLRILLDDLQRDKSGQLVRRIADLVRRGTIGHWIKLLTDLIIAGESSLAYDGQFFFDTDHSEGDSGTISNDITFNSVSTTAPLVAEMSDAIYNSIVQLMTFKDDQGEPINGDLQAVVVMVPPSMLKVANAAVTSTTITNAAGTGVETNALTSSGFTIEVVANARLIADWTTKFLTLRNDGVNEPFIRQEELPVTPGAKAEGSDLEFDEDAHEYGVKAKRNVGYAFWQSAVLTTFT